MGLQEEMFTQPDKLHITISTLVLMDDQDRRHAVDLLNECRQLIVLYVSNRVNVMNSIFLSLHGSITLSYIFSFSSHLQTD